MSVNTLTRDRDSFAWDRRAARSVRPTRGAQGFQRRLTLGHLRLWGGPAPIPARCSSTAQHAEVMQARSREMGYYYGGAAAAKGSHLEQGSGWVGEGGVVLVANQLAEVRWWPLQGESSMPCLRERSAASQPMLFGGKQSRALRETFWESVSGPEN